LQQAAKIMPYSEEVQQHLAETYIKLNQKENAVAVLTQILQSSGDIETQKHLWEKIYSLNEAAKEKN
jgi:thioredoxin-like negative regulator of GroEL